MKMHVERDFFYSVHFMITERGLCWFSKRVKPIIFSSFSQIPKLLEQHLLVKSPVFFFIPQYTLQKNDILYLYHKISHMYYSHLWMKLVKFFNLNKA